MGTKPKRVRPDGAEGAAGRRRLEGWDYRGTRGRGSNAGIRQDGCAGIEADSYVAPSEAQRPPQSFRNTPITLPTIWNA
jgi:hypothetical protein